MRILNKRYWPASVRIDYNYHKEDDIIIWCREQFGRDKFRIVGASTFYFTNEKDAVFFKLKWA